MSEHKPHYPLSFFINVCVVLQPPTSTTASKKSLIVPARREEMFTYQAHTALSLKEITYLTYLGTSLRKSDPAARITPSRSLGALTGPDGP